MLKKRLWIIPLGLLLLLFSGCKDNTAALLTKAEKMVAENVLFTTNYTAAEIDNRKPFVKLPLAKKAELKTLLHDYKELKKTGNKKATDKLKAIDNLIGKTAIERGTSDKLHFMISVNQDQKDNFIAHNFKYYPGEITLVASDETIIFTFDVPAGYIYQEIAVNEVHYIKDPQTGKLKRQATSKQLNFNYTHQYSYLVQSHLEFNFMPTKDETLYLLSWHKDLVPKSYFKDISVEQWQNNKWEPLPLTNQGAYLLVHTKIRFTLNNMDSNFIWKAFVAGSNISFKDGVGIFKMSDNRDINVVALKKVHINLTAPDYQKLTFKKGIDIPYEKGQLVTFLGQEIELTVAPTIHYDLDAFQLINKDDNNKLVALDLLEALPVDPQEKAIKRLYKIIFKVRGNLELVITEKHIYHQITMAPYGKNTLTSNFATHWQDYFTAYNFNDLTKIESGKTIQITLKPQDAPFFHYVSVNGVELAVKDNQFTFTVQNNTKLIYGIKEMYAFNLVDEKQASHLKFTGGAPKTLIEKGEIVYLDVINQAQYQEVIIYLDKEKTKKATYNAQTKQFSFKMEPGIQLLLVAQK